MGFDLYQLSSSKRQRKLELGLYSAAFGFGLILISYILFLESFVTNDFSVAEVYSYSSSSLSLVNKICASWAGGGGSILLLTLLIAFTYFAYRAKTINNQSTLTIGTSQVLNVFLIFFVIMDIGKNPFTRLAIMPPDGAGLNPALQTPWMMVHPPIVFAGYAFILLAFALVLGSMKAKDLRESKLLNVSIGIAWLLMTVGIAIGGLWAYEVLGWGGYWSWDPVETGSLLVWLGLTAYFFAKPLSTENKSLVRQFVILITFAALIFLSALTRGGLLQSVHAYALSPAGPILIGFAVSFTLYFFYLKRQVGKPLIRLNIQKQSVRSLSLATGLVSIVALFFVSLFGITIPLLSKLFTSSPWTPQASFYNTWSFPFAALLVLALVGVSFHDKLSLRSFSGFAAASVAIGLILASVKWPTPDILSNIGIPLLVLALLSISFDVAKTIVQKQRTLKILGWKLLFLGMIIGMVGILFSAATKQTVSGSILHLNNEGIATTKTFDVTVDLANWTIYSGSGKVYSNQMNLVVPEHSKLKTDVSINKDGTTQGDPLWVFLYTNYGPISKPLILHTMQGDIYVHIDVTDAVYSSLLQSLSDFGTIPSEVSITISIIPMIYLLWIGVTIMCVGIGVQVIDTARKPAAQNPNDF
jgi:cytochrome c biogenesis factor